MLPKVPQLPGGHFLHARVADLQKMEVFCPASAFSCGIFLKVFIKHLLHPGLVASGGCGAVPGSALHPPTLSSFPSPLDKDCSAQPGTMGRKKIQISRILDQRNRQVSSLGGTVVEGRHSWQETQPGQRPGHLGMCKGMSLDAMSEV